MFLPFFLALRKGGIPVSLREYLGLIEGVSHGLADADPAGFYFLARAALVKDERHLDRFDRIFAESFRGIDRLDPAMMAGALARMLDLPAEWLERLAERNLSDAEKALVTGPGGFQALMEALRARLAEQEGRHQGGSKWIGTAGTSPFGAFGYNPEGVRIGQDESRNQRAVKVWDRRDFKDFADDVELGTRNMKVVLRRLRSWARAGGEEELDLGGTIRSTAEHGYLDIRTRPERRNTVRVLLFLDVGGSMDAHVRVVEELFSAARGAFRHLEHFYFHNCIYEGLWRDNRRRWNERIATRDVLNRHGGHYRAIIVGDASMSPYEIAMAGGANEHWNEESGEVWLRRIAAHFRHLLWINPLTETSWRHSQSTEMIRAIVGSERMVPMTPGGLTRGMKVLSR